MFGDVANVAQRPEGHQRPQWQLCPEGLPDEIPTFAAGSRRPDQNSTKGIANVNPTME
jgi:hypothetical protein